MILRYTWTFNIIPSIDNPYEEYLDKNKYILDFKKENKLSNKFFVS